MFRVIILTFGVLFVALSFAPSALAEGCEAPSADLSIESASVTVGSPVVASFTACQGTSGTAELVVAQSDNSAETPVKTVSLAAGEPITESATYSAVAAGIYTATLSLADQSGVVTKRISAQVTVTAPVPIAVINDKYAYSITSSVAKGGGRRVRSVRFTIVNIGNRVISSIKLCVKTSSKLKFTSGKKILCQTVQNLAPFAKAVFRVHMFVKKSAAKRKHSVKATVEAPTATGPATVALRA